MEAYLLKSNIALIILYFLYRLIVYKRSEHHVKRYLGIGILLFSALFLVFPSFEWSVPSSEPIQQIVKGSEIVESAISFTLPKNSLSTLMVIYLAGVVVFSLRFLSGIIGIIRQYRNSLITKKWGFTVVESKKPISPFSFFNYLFIQEGTSAKKDFNPILLHEQVHKNQLHSIDVIFLEMMSVFFWFNPVVWMLKKDIKASHEFLADEYVITHGYDKLSYQDLLFEARTGVSFQSANYLSNHTSLKQRFNYMEKRESNSNSAYLRTGIVLVAMACTVLVSSFVSIPNPIGSNEPTYSIYTIEGKVDLEKGISKTSDVLYVRAQSYNKKLKYQVSKVVLTLVVGGQGIHQIKSDDSVDLSELKSKVPKEKESMIVMEIQEYMTKDADDKVETVKLKKPYFINFKLY